MINTRTAAAVLTVLAGVIGCERATSPTPPSPPQPPSSPPPSVVVVSLATPNTNDGAVIITLSGPDLATVQAADSHYVLFSRPASAQELRVIVIGNLVAGPLFTVHLGTPHLASAFSGTLQQVATRGDSVVSSTSAYRVTVSPAP